jgi:AcrR family transcriptional regulator
MKTKAVQSRKNDPVGLRNRILDAAARLFQTRGYHATGMRDVMESTDISAGALHHHFGTKEALAIAVIQERVAPAVRTTWIEPIRKASTLSKGITQVLEQIIGDLEERRSVAGCPLNNLVVELAFSHPEFREALQAVFVEWQLALSERLAQTTGGARLDRNRRAAAAAFIVSAYSGAMNLAKATQTAAPLRAAASTLAQWLRERGLNA